MLYARKPSYIKMSDYLLTLTMCCSLFVQSCGTQPYQKKTVDWLKKSYSNVVDIQDSQVSESAQNFLIDIPLEENADSSYVFLLSAHVPVQLFLSSTSFYPGIKEFILIVPDWEFYQKVGQDATNNGITLEPATTNIYYRVKRTGDSVHTDSIRISGDGHPQIHYAVPKIGRDLLVVYREESYGSLCCPKDPMWAIAEQDLPFVKGFEKSNKLTLTGTFRQNNGKEGEHTVYYTLPNLTSRQRLDFILAKRSQWVVNKGVKDAYNKAQLFTPKLIPIVKDGFNKIISVNYN